MKKKIAICAAQVPFVKGGAELLVEGLYENLKRRGYDVDVIALPFKWYPRKAIINSMVAWRFLDISESNGEKIDLVISTKFPSYMVKHENKIVWLVHQFRQIYDQYGTQYSDFSKENYFDNLVMGEIKAKDNMMLSEAKRIYTIADNTTNRLKKYNNLESKTLYHPPKHAGKYKFGEYQNYILSVGRLESIKRVDLLLKSLKYCDNDIKVKIAGVGPFKGELEKIVEKNKLKSRVEFLNFVSDDDLLKLYSDSLAVYYAPFDEDYGYVTLEAFLSGKAVITTNDSGGVLEFVENNVNGCVCGINPEEIGTKIQELYKNKNLAKDFGMNGYEKVKGISWDNVIDKLTETIR